MVWTYGESERNHGKHNIAWQCVGWTMFEFHDSNGNGLGDIWWTDKFIYLSSIDGHILFRRSQTVQ